MGLVRDIAQGLADSLATLPGAEQIEPRMNLEPNEPCIDIYPSDPFEDDTAAGFGHPQVGAFLFVVRARVGVQNTDGAQDLLLDWMDCTSLTGVAALLENDDITSGPLAGLATSVDVRPVTGFVSFLDINGKVARIGVQWIVRVIPAHS